MMNDTREWTRLPSASSGGNWKTFMKLVSATVLFGAVLAPPINAADNDANGRTPVKVAKQFTPSLPILESQQDQVKVTLSDRNAIGKPTSSDSTAARSKQTAPSSLPSRPAELVKRPASKIPPLTTAREKPSAAPVEIAVHQPVTSEAKIQVAETPYLVPSEVPPINVSKFELPPKVQLAEPPALLDKPTIITPDLAVDTPLTPKQPTLTQPTALDETTQPTLVDNSVAAIEQTSLMIDTVSVPLSELDNNSVVAIATNESSKMVDSIAIQRRKSMMKTFPNRVAKATSANEAVCKVFLVDSLNVAFLGTKDGHTTVTIEFADGTSTKQNVRIESSPSPAMVQNEQEKITNLQNALRDLYPKSELKLTKSSSGAIVVQGKLASEQDARDAMILVRQMFLVPIQDKLTVGTK